MSYWNYRVWHCEDCIGEPFVAIKETYYNENDEVTMCDASNYGCEAETVESLKQSLKLMLKACDKEVLVFKDFKFASLNKGECDE